MRNSKRLVASLTSGVLIAFAVVVAATFPARATVPNGFTETRYAAGLNQPTAMAFAPDGRLFVSEQAGKLRVIKNGVLLGPAFATLPVEKAGERGLLGVAFDPNFATNNFVYVFYTVPGPPSHNRVSRLTANGDGAVAGSEVPILDLDDLSTANIHNGGALHFGPDGKLYLATGDNGNGANSQSLATRLGKILRISTDGSIPTDNPFFNTATGANRAIYAMGLRNPFTFSFQQGTSRFFVNDVGQDTWEEIDDGIAGANYGWPNTEGVANDPQYQDPLYVYGHGTTATTGCAITGGAFYNPTTVTFPSSYVGAYFFADYCNGWINRFDVATGTVSTFASTGFAPIDLAVPADGNLYYLTRGGAIYRIGYTGSGTPVIGTQPQSQTVSVGRTATFTVAASGTGPLSYQWLRNGVTIPGATSSTYDRPNVQMSDSGAGFRVQVTNSVGSVLSAAATLTVTSDQPPTAQITQPLAGAMYSGGDTISFAGTADDPEQGALPASAYTWQIDLHHADHVHPAMLPTSDITSGSFVVPVTGHTEANVFYRVLLTVTDAQGLTTTAFRDVQPRTADMTFATSPPGLTINLDAQPQATPLTVTGVVGIQRDVVAPAAQVFGGNTYEFVGWSSGRARVHTITTPAVNTTYTATYRQVANAGGLSARYYNQKGLTGSWVNGTDGTVDFDWSTNAPVAGIDPTTFSARWVGTIEAPTTGTYTFYTQSDDGVRLAINNKFVIKNWSSHALTENSAKVNMTAGTEYPLRMEYFQDVGPAQIRLLWSGPSVPKAAVPASAFTTKFTAKINFQPGSATVPAGYLPDTGAAIGLRSSGERYGWNTNVSAQMVDRNASNSPDQRYDTFAPMQDTSAPNASWVMVVPNGAYTVRIVAGDPSATNSVYRINVEGVTVVSGTPTPAAPWIESTTTVTVTDNRLTVTSGSGAVNNKICFIEIS